jgi:hypothetical protein
MRIYGVTFPPIDGAISIWPQNRAAVYMGNREAWAQWHVRKVRSGLDPAILPMARAGRLTLLLPKVT